MRERSFFFLILFSFDQSKIQSFETQSFVNAHAFAFSLSLIRSFVRIEVSVPSWQCEFKWPVTSVVFTFITLRRDEAANIRPIDRSSVWMTEHHRRRLSTSLSFIFNIIVQWSRVKYSFFHSFILVLSLNRFKLSTIREKSNGIVIFLRQGKLRSEK